MQMRSVAFFCSLVSLSFGCQTVDSRTEYLAPVQSPYLFPAEVLANYQRVFEEGFKEDVIISVMISESLGNEKMVGIRGQGDIYEVFLVSLDRPSHAYDLNTSANVSYNTTALVRPIKKRSFLTMKEIWSYELKSVRYPEKSRIEIDGTKYTYSVSSNPDTMTPQMSGRSWGGGPSGKRIRINQVADLLVNFAQGELEEEDLVETTQNIYHDIGKSGDNISNSKDSKR